MKQKSLKMALLFTVLLGIGMNFHHPITPTLFTELGLPSRVFGTSFAVMSFFSFLTSPFWGELCNRIGRLKVFLITCIFYGIGQFFLGEATTELQVYGARMLSGIFMGGINIANMVYIIDISTEEQKSRNMNLYTTLQTVSSAFGFLIGGLIGTFIHYEYNCIVQAIWMISTGILGYVLMKESYRSTEKNSLSTLIKKANPFSSFIKAGSLLNKVTWFFFITVLLTGFATTCYDNAFNYYLKDQLNFLPAYNGIMKAVIGIITLVVNFTITLWIIRKKHLSRNFCIVLFFCATAAFLGLINGSLPYFIFVNLIFFIFNSIYQPIQRALSVQGKEFKETGIIAGLYNSMSMAGNVFGGLFVGWIYGYNVQLPFLFTGIVFLLAVLSSYIYYKRSNQMETII